MGATGSRENWVLLWWVGPCSEIFNPVFWWWVWLCSLIVCDLRPNYGRSYGDLRQKDIASTLWLQDCCIPCPWPHSTLLLTHSSIRGSWTLTGKSGSVSCVVTYSTRELPHKWLRNSVNESFPFFSLIRSTPGSQVSQSMTVIWQFRFLHN